MLATAVSRTSRIPTDVPVPPEKTPYGFLPHLYPGTQLDRFLPLASRQAAHRPRPEVLTEEEPEVASWRRRARHRLVDAIASYALNNWTPQDLAHLLSPLAREAIFAVADDVADRLRYNDDLEYATYLCWVDARPGRTHSYWQEIEACERAAELLEEAASAGRALNWLPAVTHVLPTDATPVVVALMRRIRALRERASATPYAAESAACTEKAVLLEDELALQRIRKFTGEASGPAATRVYVDPPWLRQKFRAFAALAIGFEVGATLVDESGIVHVTGQFEGVEGFRRAAVRLSAHMRSEHKRLGSCAGEKDLNKRELARGFYQGLATTLRLHSATASLPIVESSHQPASAPITHPGWESSFERGMSWGINSGVSFLKEMQQRRHTPSTPGYGPEAS